MDLKCALTLLTLPRSIVQSVMLNAMWSFRHTTWWWTLKGNLSRHTKSHVTLLVTSAFQRHNKLAFTDLTSVLTSPGVPGPAGVCQRTSASHLAQHWPISSPRCEQSTRTPSRHSPPSSAAPPEWARGLEKKKGNTKGTLLAWHLGHRYDLKQWISDVNFKASLWKYS